MAELAFFTGTMDCGKSTLALQMDHNHAARGRIGRIFTSQDRAGPATLSSRLGLETDALEVSLDFDFWRYTVDTLTSGGRIDYLVCDETQFYTPWQVEQLARIADELDIDVFAFGILTDFRTVLFPDSARLNEGGVVDKALLECTDCDQDFTAEWGFAIHMFFNGLILIPLTSLILLIVSFFAKVPRGAALAGGIVVLVLLQVFVLPTLSREVGSGFGALHGINALLLLGLAIMAGQRASQPVSTAADAERVSA